MLVKLKKCHPNAVILDQKKGNVGFDIYAVEDTELKPSAVTKVRTGLAIADYDESVGVSDLRVEKGEHGTDLNLHCSTLTVYPKIEGRSGLAAMGVFPVGNIIDPNYRGEMCVTLANMNADPYRVKVGDRVAQFVFYACLSVPNIRFEEVDEVVETDRGSKGFGSSGR